jgi:hypothetical protein
LQFCNFMTDCIFAQLNDCMIAPKPWSGSARGLSRHLRGFDTIARFHDCMIARSHDRKESI